MSSIQDEILEQFYSTLKKTENFDEERVEQLRVLFGGNKKPKPADVIRVLSEDAKESQP
jgi:CMP-2-keto-3-deoxyoctulosonic acid synthetase